MFSKSVVFLALLAVAQLATASPPACFLAAINTQKTLNDYKGICGSSASDVQSSIESVCHGDSVQAALSAFSAACGEKGIKVSTPTSISSSPSATGSKSNGSGASSMQMMIVYTSAVYDPSCSCSKTIAVTSTELIAATGKPSGSATGTATGVQSSKTGAASRIEGSLAGGLFAVGVGVLAVL